MSESRGASISSKRNVRRVRRLSIAAIAITLASTAYALEKTTDIPTFGELPAGAEAGAQLEDFCAGKDGIALRPSLHVSPMSSAEVIVKRTPAGFSASVVLRDDETTTRDAVYAIDRLILRLGHPCEDALDAVPIVAIGAVGLRILHDKDGNPDFHLQGASQ